jgi:hypothetical protein
MITRYIDGRIRFRDEALKQPAVFSASRCWRLRFF